MARTVSVHDTHTVAIGETLFFRANVGAQWELRPYSHILGLTTLAGGWAGAWLANRLTGARLRLAFGLFVCAMGVYLVHGALKRLGWF